MQLSATESNLIGTAGNLGMYASGIPLGYMVDKRGPHPGVLLGSLALGAGYFPIKKAYDAGPGSMGVPLLFFLSFLTGFGSCAAFQAAIKTSALNWPLHRGTATAFPLAAFGLSAFFFTALSGLVFGDDTSDYLLLLAGGTFVLTFVSLFFVSVPHADVYHAISTSEDHPGRARRDSNPLHRTELWLGKANAPRTREEPSKSFLFWMPFIRSLVRQLPMPSTQPRPSKKKLRQSLMFLTPM
jgi:MFS family permease